MPIRRVGVIVSLVILLHPFSVDAVGQGQQPGERGSKLDTSAAGPHQETQANEDRRTPRLQPAEMRKIRLPDVTITAVVAKGTQTNASRVVVNGTIGGTIPFKVSLPEQWSGRFLMKGFAAPNRYGTAEGNAVAELSYDFYSIELANNVEAQLNLAYVAVHRVAEVAKAIIYKYYGSDSRVSYFVGCSWGGGQALKAAQRYPMDFDGIIAASPIVDWTGLVAARVHNAQHFFPNPSALDEPLISEEVLTRLYTEVLSQCDHIDGVKDGIIDDPRVCRFDLSRVSGLSSRQRKAIQAVYDGPHNDNGQIYPGMPLGTENGWFKVRAGAFPNYLSKSGYPNFEFQNGISSCKEIIFGDAAWDYSTYSFSNWKRDSRIAGSFLNSNNPDLSKFKANGRKLIVWHGWSDEQATTPFASISYFDEVETRDSNVRDYFRLFLLPGVEHCADGVGPDRVDWLELLIHWVERGKEPHRVIASKTDGNENVTMTRPVYPYPLRAVYKGSGSTDDAANFLLKE